jgi:hypothetical protein
MVGDENLGADVVLVEAQMGGGGGARPDGLTGWQPLERGNFDLDDQAAAGFQLGGGVAEARHLGVLGGQVLDGVAQQVDGATVLREPGGDIYWHLLANPEGTSSARSPSEDCRRGRGGVSLGCRLVEGPRKRAGR